MASIAEASGSSKPSSQPRLSAKSTADPILRNALRYSISAKEYETLHKYIISRSKVLRRNAPTVAKVEKLVKREGRNGEPAGDDYNAAAIRASLRVFLASSAGLKIWELVGEKFLGKERNRYYFAPNLSFKQERIELIDCAEVNESPSTKMPTSDSPSPSPQSCSSTAFSSASSRAFERIFSLLKLDLFVNATRGLQKP